MWYKLESLNGIIFNEKYLINKNGDVMNKYSGLVYRSYRRYDGRHQISLEDLNGTRHLIYIYRLKYNNFVASISDGMVINHLNTDPSDDEFINLECGTQLDNVRHSFKIGTFNPRGENNGNHKKIFIEDKIHVICRYLENRGRYTYSEILENVNIPINKENLCTMTKIRTGKIWRHISSQYSIPNYEPRVMFSYKEYEDDIKKLLNSGYSIREIANMLSIELCSKKERDKFWKYVSRFRKNSQRSTTIPVVIRIIDTSHKE